MLCSIHTVILEFSSSREEAYVFYKLPSKVMEVVSGTGLGAPPTEVEEFDENQMLWIEKGSLLESWRRIVTSWPQTTEVL